MNEYPPADNGPASDATPPAASPQQPHYREQPPAASPTVFPLVVYICYLLCYFAYLPMIVGVVIAYTAKADSGALASAHYRFQIRTFWIGLVYSLIVTAIALTVILFPLAILLGSLWVIWVVIRSVRGIVSLQRKEAPHNLKTWLY